MGAEGWWEADGRETHQGQDDACGWCLRCQAKRSGNQKRLCRQLLQWGALLRQEGGALALDGPARKAREKHCGGRAKRGWLVGSKEELRGVKSSCHENVDEESVALAGHRTDPWKAQDSVLQDMRRVKPEQKAEHISTETTTFFSGSQGSETAMSIYIYICTMYIYIYMCTMYIHI